MNGIVQWVIDIFDEPDVSTYAIAQALGRERLERTRIYADDGSRKVLERMRAREAKQFLRRRA